MIIRRRPAAELLLLDRKWHLEMIISCFKLNDLNTKEPPVYYHCPPPPSIFVEKKKSHFLLKKSVIQWRNWQVC